VNAMTAKTDVSTVRRQWSLDCFCLCEEL